MAYEIRVPRLGWSMEEGTFIRWLKKDGDPVRPGEPLFELEGEKALQEIEAADSGTLRIAADCPADGTVVPVGALLGHLVEAGEMVGGQRAEVRGQEKGGSGQNAKDSKQTLPVARPEMRSTATGTVPASSPRARRVATELGVRWQSLAGTGRDGRVREQDVRAAAARHSHPSPLAKGEGASQPLSSRRRIIAERMSASSSQSAPVTLTTRSDATNLVSLRRQFQAAGSTVPGYTDIVAKLAAVVLRQHPQLAARWNGDRLESPADDGYHIGIAVDTEDGLLVPVLRDVVRRSLAEIAADSQHLVEQARTGRLAAADMQGGVFTITNLGSYGIDAFTPIINLPEVAILGLGAIRREAVVLDDGQIAARDMLALSLTFDHRAVDGAPAARFLQALAAAIANPAAWLV
jgi:pyruvate dehydrogenase E2 component (dihydrolipoamide acetyltransferase)